MAQQRRRSADGRMAMPTSEATFAVLLRRHRMLAGLSQEELAERARVSVNAIGSLERGVNRQPHPRTVAFLAAALALEGEPRAVFIAAARSGVGDQPTGARLQPIERLNDREIAAIPSNLPTSSTSFVGREREVAAIEALLRQPDVRPRHRDGARWRWQVSTCPPSH
jgi:transcriptional regulator with XRE-family HTH domain